jgi:hypothetical protein
MGRWIYGKFRRINGFFIRQMYYFIEIRAKIISLAESFLNLSFMKGGEHHGRRKN